MTVNRILIVEDSVDSREMLAKILELEGYIVTTAEDGMAGLRMAFKELPDLIITDIGMPNLNGIELIKALRKHQKLKRMPILVVTAYMAGKASEAMIAGADCVMAKPLDLSLFIEGVKNLLLRLDRPNALQRMQANSGGICAGKSMKFAM